MRKLTLKYDQMRILWQYVGLNKITRVRWDKRCIFLIVATNNWHAMTSVMSKVESNHTRIFQANTNKSEYLTALKEIHECGDIDDSVIYNIIRHVEFT